MRYPTVLKGENAVGNFVFHDVDLLQWELFSRKKQPFRAKAKMEDVLFKRMERMADKISLSKMREYSISYENAFLEYLALDRRFERLIESAPVEELDKEWIKVS
eukprot:UN22406